MDWTVVSVVVRERMLGVGDEKVDEKVVVAVMALGAGRCDFVEGVAVGEDTVLDRELVLPW